MRKLRSFTDQPLTVGQEITLDDRSAHHLRSVLRLNHGHEVELFNGDGSNYISTLTTVNKKTVVAMVMDCQPDRVSATRHIILQQALIKPDRLDWLIQKATELGIADIQLLQTQRVNFKISKERLQKKLHHWQAIAISASEQCGRTRIPGISLAGSIDDLTPLADTTGVVLHPYASAANTIPTTDNLIIAIGPEGGFTGSEIQNFESLQYSCLALQGYILRAETAAIASITLAAYHR